jgi:putative ABC transport system permease protein
MLVYKLLLYIYPESFRAEYGEEMADIFCRRMRDCSGILAAIGIWLDTLLEMPFSAMAAHWDVLRQDLRYTARTLARTPGFTLTAMLVVGIGVGANTAAFSVADFVMIRPLPFKEPERLVKLWEAIPGYDQMEPSPATYRDWKRMSTAFESMGAYHPIAVNLVGQGDPERIAGSTITAEVFQMLGVQPMIGRLFTESDCRNGAARTVLLSYPLWQAVFGGDRGVVGQTLSLDNGAYTVIGVMPREFNFPSRESELWTAKQFQDQEFEDRNDNYLDVVARLNTSVSPGQAQSEMNVVAIQLERQYPRENERHGATVIGLRDNLSQQSRMLLIALCGAALCVLLIACANLASLLLARALVRQRELAVRAALGAGRERLVRQMITESLVLAGLGGGLGLGVAVAATPLLTRLVPSNLPIAQQPSMDIRVIAFAGLLTGITGIAFGLVPALRICRGSDLGGLREGARAGGGKKERLRSILVMAEITASVVLLVSTGLLVRALWRLQATDPGFRTEGVTTLGTALPFPKYNKTATREQFYTRVLSEIRQLPGVQNAAYAGGLPMVWGGGIWPVSVGSEEVLDRSASNTAEIRFVTPGFFAAMGIPLRLGRDFIEQDTADSAWVAVVSESLAQRYWPGENPLGRHFKVAFHDRMVVGVVGDIKVRGIERTSEPQLYLGYKQVPDGWLTFYAPKDLVIRAAGTPAALLPAVRGIIRSADPDQPISDIRTLAEIVEQNTASRAVQARALGALAAIAFLLAAVGIHGLLSFAVSQRAQEIGVRIALGARSGDILRMVMRQGMLLAGGGVAAGLVLAYASARAIESLLAGVKPGDPVTFLSVAALCGLMTIAGVLAPAFRAVRTDPIMVIRAE